MLDLLSIFYHNKDENILLMNFMNLDQSKNYLIYMLILLYNYILFHLKYFIYNKYLIYSYYHADFKN